MLSKFNSNKVTFSSTTQDVVIVDSNNRQSKPSCHHTLSIVHKVRTITTHQTAASKARQKLIKQGQ